MFILIIEITPEFRRIIKDYHETLISNRNNYFTSNKTLEANQKGFPAARGFSDVFYVPQSLFKKFHLLCDLYNEKDVTLGRIFNKILLLTHFFLCFK